MDMEEIRNYLNAARSHSVCVERSLPPEFPGFVRTVTIREGYRVSIEYEAYGMDEGGAYFWGRFADLDEAVSYLEGFLGKPLSAWENFSKSGRYPDRDPNADPDEGAARLSQALATNAPCLPSRLFELKGSYWVKFRNTGG
jgi:hypothetical protein